MNRATRRAEASRQARYRRILTKVLKFTAFSGNLDGHAIVREARFAAKHGVISPSDLLYIESRTDRTDEVLAPNLADLVEP